LPKKKSALLAAALVGALGLTAGQAVAAPVGLKIAADKSVISHKDESGAGMMLRLWFVDADGNPTTSDVQHTILVGDIDTGDATVVLPGGSVTFPKDAKYVMVPVGGNPTSVDVTSVGNGILKASVATPGSTVAASDELPISVVEDYLSASLLLSNGTPAATAVDAFSVTSGGTAYTGGVGVDHIVAGIGSAPVEMIPANSVTNNNGNLNLTFTKPSGAIAEAKHEYYVLTAAGMGQAVVANAGNDTISDIDAGAATSVMFTDANGNKLTSLATVEQADGTFVGTLSSSSLVALDAAGNPTTLPGGVQISGITSGAGATLSGNTVVYPAGFAGSQETLSVSFSEPAGASLELLALSPNSQPRLEHLALTTDWQFPARNGAVFQGGHSVSGNVMQQDAYFSVSNGSKISLKLQARVDPTDVGKPGKYILLLGWYPPMESGVAPIYWDFGAGKQWNYDLSMNGLGAWGGLQTSFPAGDTTVIEADKDLATGFYTDLGVNSDIMWVVGYQLTDSDTMQLAPAWVNPTP
jgi:hypothetical protein